MTYNQERRIFDRLKTDLKNQTKIEYENAFNVLIEKYNTSIYENRFITGGAIEVFTYALLRSVGIDCNMYGNQSLGGDILLPNQKLLSVKGIFTGGVNNVILMNKQGSGKRKWNTATLFIISEIGIVYGDPNMVKTSNIKDRSDSLVLDKKGLIEIIKNNKNYITMKLNKKPPTETSGFSDKASVAVAKQILQETNSQTLLKGV